MTCPGGCWNGGATPYNTTGAPATAGTVMPVLDGQDINAVARQQSCGMMYMQLNTYIQAQMMYYTNKKAFATDIKKELNWFTTQQGYKVKEYYSDAYKHFIEAVPEFPGLNRLVAGVYLYKPQGLISLKSLLLTGVNNQGVLKMNEGYQTEEPTIVGYSNQCY